MADLVALRPAKRRRRNGWKADPQKSYFARVPNEILLLIATAGDDDLTLNSLKTIACLARTSKDFYDFLNPILYRHGVSRHPYLLHWASHVGNLGTAQLAIAAGANLNAFCLPDKSFGYAPSEYYFARFRRDTYKEVHNRPYKAFRGKKSPNPKHKRLTLFRSLYRVGDGSLQRAGSCSTPNLTLAEFCNTQRETTDYIALFRVSQYMNSLSQGTWSHTAASKYSCSAAPIHLASIGGHSDIITELLAHGAVINSPSHYLCDCALRHEHSTVRVAPFHLVRSAFKPEAYGNAVKRDLYPWTWTALHLALCHGQEAAFWVLLSKGARNIFAAICGSGFVYSDVLHHTIALQQWPIARMLIDSYGYLAEISKKDALGITPIWVAYYDNKMDVVGELVQHGADINEDLGNGFTPLIHACMFGRWGQAIDLINLGANIDTRFKDYHCEDIYRYEHENGRILQGAMYKPLDLVVARWSDPSSSSIWNEAIEGRYQPVRQHLRAQQEMTLVDLLLDRGAKLVSDSDEPQVGSNDCVYSVPRSIDTVSNAAQGHQIRHLARILRSDQFTSYFKQHGHQRIVHAMLGPSHCPGVPRERAGDRGKWTESWATQNANKYYCGCFRDLHDNLVECGYPGFMEDE
ncbi:ankyrin repeat-containing domain protein [Triangularia setosa]|uniref:Ankyrin repeat-containing domain protein n=1 Tax=Triangularia setosa TaxID=2587417 RepID=A0AAN7A5R3_9PEZI|nr:ankyrin repeat-containing domain protein [Podospora setosa]